MLNFILILSLFVHVYAQTFPGSDRIHDYKLNVPSDMSTFYTTSSNGNYYARSYKRSSDSRGVIEMYSVNNVTNELVLEDTIIQPTDSSTFANGNAGTYNTQFGFEIEVWGEDMLAVASPSNGGTATIISGKAFFYRRNTNGDWIPHAVIAHNAGQVTAEVGYFNRHMVACETATQYVLHTLSYEYAQYFYANKADTNRNVYYGGTLKTDNSDTSACSNAGKLTVDQSTCQIAFAYYSCGVIKYRLGPGVSTTLFPRTGELTHGTEGQSDGLTGGCNYDASKLYIPFYGIGTARSYLQMIGTISGHGSDIGYTDYPNTKTLFYDLVFDDANTIQWPVRCEYFKNDNIITTMTNNNIQHAIELYNSGIGSTTGPIDPAQYRLVTDYTGVSAKSFKNLHIFDNKAFVSITTGESYFYSTVIPPTPSPTVSPTPAPTFECVESSTCSETEYCSSIKTCDETPCTTDIDCDELFLPNRIRHCDTDIGFCRDLYPGTCTTDSYCNTLKNIYRHTNNKISQKTITISSSNSGVRYNTTLALKQKLAGYNNDTVIAIRSTESGVFPTSVINDVGEAAFIEGIKNTIIDPEYKDAITVVIDYGGRLLSDERELLGAGEASVTITYNVDSNAYNTITQNGLDSGDFINNLASDLGIGPGNITIQAINGQIVVEIAVIDPDPYNTDPLGEDLITVMQNIESEMETIRTELLNEIVGLNSEDILSEEVDYCSNRDCSGNGDSSVDGTNSYGCVTSTGVCACTQGWGINCETPCECLNGRPCINNVCNCQFPEYGLRCELTKSQCLECL